MQIPEQELETQDLDWFALDKEGAIGHFTTGGCGGIPRSIAASAEDLKTVTEHVRRLVPIALPLISEAFRSFVVLRGEKAEAEARYLRDYARMASLGLFSYDFLRTRKRPTGYFQVAAPSVPLREINLPAEIRQILDRTVLGGVCFRTTNQIDLDVLG